MHSSFTIPFPYFTDTDHHSGSESSSSSGSDEQSGMSSINTTTASGYTTSGQPHQASSASNDGYYNSARNTTPQANGNQVITRLVETSFKIAVSSKASYRVAKTAYKKHTVTASSEKYIIIKCKNIFFCC